MSEETPVAASEAPTTPAAKAPSPPNKLLLPFVIGVMTVAGGLAGVLVVGPRIVAARSTVAEGLEPAGPAEGKPEDEPPHEEGGEKGPTFKIDNLIVNPAGSQGSRFLMVSVAVETPDAKLDASLRSREAQIRDLLIAMFERQTMEQLAAPGIRDTLKSRLADTLTALVGAKTKLRVFLPQFVIQ
jgi:flagellar FliL protein